LVQAFLKKWWVESDFKAPNLPLSLRFKGSKVTTRVSFIVRQVIWGPPSSHKVQGRAMVRVPGVAKLWLYLKMQKYIVYEMFVHMLLKWL
jgi:hypothetical protein